MTQEEKQLVLQDICARIPYSQIVNIDGEPKKLIAISNDFIHFADLTDNDLEGIFDLDSCVVKPYLHPMSSMTEDERKEFRATQYEEVIEQYPCSADPNEIKILSYTTKTFDWLNEHYFDFRGLIKNGLAIEAPNNMY